MDCGTRELIQGGIIKNLSIVVGLLSLAPMLGWAQPSISSILTAQSWGTFNATGNMIRPRQMHSATLLPDGTVLIAGGYEFTPAIPRRAVTTDTADLYNPDLGTFAATGRMTTVRALHSATLLPNGKVLIAGGRDGQDFSAAPALASAEVYDPSTGAFTPTGSMNGARARHSATLLANGTVLIAGGYDGQVRYSEACKCRFSGTATAELYDPATGTFTPVGEMTAPLAGPIATLLSDGKVWITTGDDGPDFAAQLYDPDSGAFSDTGWRDARFLIAATVNLLASGQLLITLNVSECDFLSTSAGLHDVSTGDFRDAGPMAYAICRPTGVTLSDGSVLISGGQFRGGRRPAQVYDPVSGHFSLTGEMVTGRAYHTATLLPSGNVLLAGGCVDDCLTDNTAASAEIYTPLVRKPVPVLLTTAGENPEQAAILHTGTSQVASPAHPARGGEIVEIYFTGLLDNSVIPPQVMIGGRTAKVLFFGKGGGYPNLNQVNVRVPDQLESGSAVPVRLTYLGRPSNEVTIAVQ